MCVYGARGAGRVGAMPRGYGVSINANGGCRKPRASLRISRIFPRGKGRVALTLAG